MRQHRLLSRAAVALGMLAAPLLVRADGDATTAVCPIDFEYAQTMFEDVDYDTGWVPDAGAPIRLRFFVHAGGGVEAYLAGDAVMSLPEAYDLSYVGEPDGGELAMDMGVVMEGKLAWDLPIIGQGETDLPLVPNFDFLFWDVRGFTPFLLDGSVQAPVHVEDSIESEELYSVAIDEALLGVDIPGIGGEVTVFASGTFSTDMWGNRLVTTPVDGEPIVHDEEGAAEHWPDRGLLQESGEVVYEADLELIGTITLTPSVVIELLMYEWTLAEFDIPIELVDATNTWVFAPAPLDFDLTPPPEDGTGDASVDSPGDGGTDDPWADQAGCGCAAAGSAPPPGALGALLALSGLG